MHLVVLVVDEGIALLNLLQFASQLPYYFSQLRLLSVIFSPECLDL